MEVEENIYLSNVTSYYEKRANMLMPKLEKEEISLKEWPVAFKKEHPSPRHKARFYSIH